MPGSDPHPNSLTPLRQERGTLVPKLDCSVPPVESRMTGMRNAEKDRLALSVADRHSEFEEARRESKEVPDP
jgi:hypothetical protein